MPQLPAWRPSVEPDVAETLDVVVELAVSRSSGSWVAERDVCLKYPAERNDEIKRDLAALHRAGLLDRLGAGDPRSYEPTPAGLLASKRFGPTTERILEAISILFRRRAHREQRDFREYDAHEIVADLGEQHATLPAGLVLRIVELFHLHAGGGQRDAHDPISWYWTVPDDVHELRTMTAREVYERCRSRRGEPASGSKPAAVGDSTEPPRKASLRAQFALGDVVDLILKGGGAKGAAHVGAIEVISQTLRIRTYAGTSAGAIAATLFAVGFTPSEVAEAIEKPFALIRGGDDNHPIDADDLARVVLSGAMFPTVHLVSWLDNLLRERFDDDEDQPSESITFAQVARHLATDVNLLIFASDAKKGLQPFGFVRNGDNTSFVGGSEDMAVSEAVAASLAIPWVFDAPKGFGTTYLDGGLFANFPIAPTLEVLSDAGLTPNLLGIGLVEAGRVESSQGFTATLGATVGAVTDARDASAVADLAAEGRLITIGVGPFSTIDFHLSKDDQALLIECARVKTAQAILARLIKSAGGIEALPAKQTLRLFPDDDARTWSDLQSRLTGRSKALEKELLQCDIARRRPQWLSLATDAALVIARVQLGKRYSAPQQFIAGMISALVLAGAVGGGWWWMRTPSRFQLGPQLATCIALAQAHGRPYVITNLAVLASVSRSAGTGYTIDTRFVYSGLALRDLSGASAEFQESFTSLVATLEPWHGAQVEDRAGNPLVYDVHVDARVGETFTVVTGVRYRLERPPAARESFRGITIPEGVDYVIYPNTSDAICDASVVISSPDIPLEPYLAGAYRRAADGRPVEGGLLVGLLSAAEGGDTPSARSLSGRWTGLEPGDRFGLVFYVQGPSAAP